MSSWIFAEILPLSKSSDLKKFYQPFFSKAFAVAIIAHYIGIGVYWGIFQIQEARKPYGVKIITYADLGPPPALTNAPPTPEVEVTTAAKPVIGIPDPVEDTEVSAEMTIATQTQMSQSIAPVLQETAEEKIIIHAPKQEKIEVAEEVLPQPDEFVAYEEPPSMVQQVLPEYPEMARKAGVEGMVLLKVLVDKEGNVRDVKVIKGPGAGLDESAITSAKESKWTPAIQNHKPVAVWVLYPVRFNLR